MITHKIRSIVGLGLLFGAVISNTAVAQVTGVLNSNVDAYFGSQNDVYQDSNPTGLFPWPAAGPNPPAFYGTINQLPGVPAPPNGSIAPSGVTPYAPAASSSSFNDGGGNTASSAILGFVSGSSGTADDAQTGLFMTLSQTAGGYAYEQLNYDIDFSVTNVVNSTGTAGTLPGIVNRAFSVSGVVGSTAGGFVAFGGEMSFWDATTNTLLGAPLLFNYYNGVPGPFTASVTASSIIGAVNFPDVLRITGDFFLIGDPSTITVNSVPEPSTGVLAALGIVGILVRVRRKKTRVAA